MTTPSRPARPSRRRSSIVAMAPQQGHCAPERLIVPPPSSRSCARRRAAAWSAAGTPKTTPVRSPFGVIVRRTRFVPFFASQRVLSNGIVARHPLQRAVRAHRYATVGVATQRGLRRSPRYAASNSRFSGSASTSPAASGSSSRRGRGSNGGPPGAGARNSAYAG